VNPSPEEQWANLISEVGLEMFPADVQDEVEALLALGQSLEPATRARLVNAAGRSVRRIALSHSPLEVLLFKARRDRELDADQLALEISIDGATLRRIERGQHAIDNEHAERIAAWIRSLDINRETAVDALRRSLGRPVGEPSYAGQTDLRLTESQEEFVRNVEAALSVATDEADADG
jgi:hypothetical protein